MNHQQLSHTLARGALAGAAGGLAEIAWVMLYAAAGGGNAALLARGVTTATGVDALFPTAAVESGVTIHMAIAVLLGMALSSAWKFYRERGGRVGPYGFMLAALAGVWGFNFFVLLPVLSPAFIGLVPYAVSLASKLLFGLAAATALRREPVVFSLRARCANSSLS